MATHIETTVPRSDDSEPFPCSIRKMLETAYAQYLDLETLFDIQVASTDEGRLVHPEEEIFRTVHLSSELWLRQAGDDISRARDALQGGNVVLAIRLVRRASVSLERVGELTSMLEMMSVADYHAFRVHLGDASGLQSPGYAYVRRECRQLNDDLDRCFGDDDSLFAIFTTGQVDPLYDLYEALLNLDVNLDRFRMRHLQVAERFLAETTRGTGGEGIGYLRGNIGSRMFPRLWQVRQRVAHAAGTGFHGYGNREASCD